MKQLLFDYRRMKWLDEIYYKEKFGVKREDVSEIERWLKTDTSVPDTLEGNLGLVYRYYYAYVASHEINEIVVVFNIVFFVFIR